MVTQLFSLQTFWFCDVSVEMLASFLFEKFKHMVPLFIIYMFMVACYQTSNGTKKVGGPPQIHSSNRVGVSTDNNHDESNVTKCEIDHSTQS